MGNEIIKVNKTAFHFEIHFSASANKSSSEGSSSPNRGVFCLRVIHNKPAVQRDLNLQLRDENLSANHKDPEKSLKYSNIMKVTLREPVAVYLKYIHTIVLHRCDYI